MLTPSKALIGDRFMYNLRRDLRAVWRARSLALKPIGLTVVLLALTHLLRRSQPWLFLTLLDKADSFATTVFAAVIVPYAIVVGKVIGVIWIQNDNTNEALRVRDFASFESWCYRRIPAPMKMMLFFMSVMIGYGVACVDFGSLKNDFVAEGMAYFTLTLVWMVAYEMDDPLCGVWNVRAHIPEEWWEKIKCNFIVSSDGKRVTLREEFTIISRMTLQNGNGNGVHADEEERKELAEELKES